LANDRFSDESDAQKGVSSPSHSPCGSKNVRRALRKTPREIVYLTADMCVQSLSWQLSFFFFFNEEKMASFLACKTTFIYITQSRTQLQRMVDGAGGGQLAQANRSANR
jgi:hypothetical protein